MKIEIGMGGGAWSDEDRGMVAAVLGTKAFNYLISNLASNENLLMAVGSDENLQNKLSDLVDHPNFSNFSWNYAIFWQISCSKSGDWVLGWGDGSCREPKEGEESEATRILNLRFEDETQQRMRKRVLQKLHALSGESDEDNYALGLDRVTDTEMFFLASMYFSFPRGEGGPGKCFASGKHIWVADALRTGTDYCVRSFLAKSAGIQTIVLVATDVGVVELGSVRSVPESTVIVQSIRSAFSAHNTVIRAKPMVPAAAPALPVVNEKKDENSLFSNVGIVERVEGIPKIFGQELNNSSHGHGHGFREKLAVRKMEERASSWDVYQNGNRLAFPGNRNGLHGSSWAHNFGLKQGSTAEVYSSQIAANNLQELVNGVREEFRLNQFQPQKQVAGGNCNVAIAASRLGLSCATIGHVGNEIYGNFLLDVLRDEKISVVGMSEDIDVTDSSSISYETLLCWVLVDPLQRHGFCSRADFSDEPAFSWVSKLSTEVKTAIKQSKVLFCNGYGFDELSPSLMVSALDYAVEVGTSVFFDPGPRGRSLSTGTPEEQKAVHHFLKMSDVLLLTSDECCNIVLSTGGAGEMEH